MTCRNGGTRIVDRLDRGMREQHDAHADSAAQKIEAFQNVDPPGVDDYVPFAVTRAFDR